MHTVFEVPVHATERSVPDEQVEHAQQPVVGLDPYQ